MTRSLGKIFSRSLGWILVAVIFYYLLKFTDVQSVTVAMRELKAWQIGGVILFTIAANLMQGLRFYFLWPSEQVPAWKQALLTACVHTGNILLPLKAGETVRPLMLMKWDDSVTVKQVVYWSVIDKIFEFASLLPFVLMASWTLNYHVTTSTVLSVAGLGTLIVWGVRTKIRARSFVSAYFFSTLYWFATIGVFFMVLPQLNHAIGLMVGTTFASSLPGIPAGLGPFEAAFVWVGNKAGLDAGRSMGLALSTHGLMILATVAVGLPLGALWGWPKRSEQVTVQVQMMPLSQKLSNIGVYFLGAFTLLSTFGMWVPEKDLRRRNGKNKLGESRPVEEAKGST